MQWNFLYNMYLLCIFQQKSICCDIVLLILFAGSLRNYNHYVAAQEMSSEHLQFLLLKILLTEKSEHKGGLLSLGLQF